MPPDLPDLRCQEKCLGLHKDGSGFKANSTSSDGGVNYKHVSRWMLLPPFPPLQIWYLPGERAYLWKLRAYRHLVFPGKGIAH